MKRSKKRMIRIIAALLPILVAAAIYKGYPLYRIFYHRAVKADAVLYIPPGADFPQVVDSLRALHVLENEQLLLQVAAFDHYRSHIPAGCYRLKAGMTARTLVRKLKAGRQDPVRLVIAGNIRTLEKLAAVLARNIAADSTAMYRTLCNDTLVRRFGYTPATLPGMIVPNTYEVYWTVTPEKLLERLHKEYSAFWNTGRTERLQAIGLRRDEVIALAAIVCEETNKIDEMPRIAGVYINRLKIRMPLQADPTVKYAVGDFALKRVLDRHTHIDSPYNTYKYIGLPPGAICVPSIAAIDAVLHYEQHRYLYFCARDDFSGYHAFAQTLAQHSQNAARYHAALNRAGIVGR